MTSRGDSQMVVRTAAWMYAGAAVLGLVEGFIPGTPPMPMVSGIVALAMTAFLLAFGRRLPVKVLPALSLFGVGVIAYALAVTEGYSDGAVLYAWPVIWTAYFFGRRATALVLVATAVAHALAITAMPPGVGYASRWLDVMGAMTIVAIVVRVLAESNDRLLAHASAEARVDELTGLLNRRGLAERAAVELERARRERTAIGAIAIDIDHFKQIND
ncbi:MAG TPA: diguanylate cyclase, partial [Solirubrobacteraceae bacterium]